MTAKLTNPQDFDIISPVNKTNLSIKEIKMSAQLLKNNKWFADNAIDIDFIIVPFLDNLTCTGHGLWLAATYLNDNGMLYFVVTITLRR